MLPLTDIVQIAVAAVGFVGSVLVFWWRLTKHAHRLLATQEGLIAEVTKLRGQIAHTGKLTREALEVMGRRIGDLEKGFAVQSTILGEREKDAVRLEGQVEQLGSLIIKQVAAVQGVVSSIDALWRTLERLFPEMPRRLSDRK